MGTLYIVATPIGNLEDITKRALRILSEVDLILCEDTRNTKVLLDHYQIKVPTLSYHQHSELKKTEEIISFLREGKNIALVSDAGTPGISDPGNQLVELLISGLGDNIKITPIPGPSALTAIASISGFPTDRFLFLGFPPVKKRRSRFFEEVINSKYPVIFYESPYRILKTLNEFNSLYTRYKIQDTIIVVCRELTKKFEKIYRGTAAEIIKSLEKEKIRGEFAVIVKK
ncbi:MAG: 16S rRNA (cytidine(1402)-2'-O)-methyltransferase [bacterium]|nr:16S rRNA (cytidine(1402)-2'-O)-methyltransferase [bacterium]